ncbi:MAG: SLC13 family permease [Erysipelotrichia bacterium]|nr:SLC13 family permease [Erysipelotrichia bacterium]
MIYVVAFSIAILLGLLIQNRFKPSVLFFGLILVYYFLDFIKIETLLKNFVNQSLVTLILLLIVSIVLEKTTFIATLSTKLFSPSLNKSVLTLSFFTSLLSAFLNNTAVVAALMSVIKQNRYHAPSKLLLSLSYAAIFGGTITLVGTSTNLIVNGFVLERGLPSLEMFDFIYVGIPIALIGAFVLVFITRFLPDYKVEESFESYFIEAQVQENSALIGKSIKENGLRNLEYLFLSEVLRNGHILSPVHPNEILQAGDVLIFSGDIKEIALLQKFKGLEFLHVKHDLSKNLVEAIVSHESTMVGKTLKEVNFRTKFDASVVALKRGTQKLSGKIGESVLCAGDSLVLAVGNDFYQRDNLKKNFYLLNDLQINNKLSQVQSLFAIFSFLAVIVLSVFKLLSLLKGLFVLLAIFLALKLLSFDEIKRRFPYDLVLIIGSALGMSGVILESGLAQAIAKGLIGTFEGMGVYGVFFAIYLFTALLTEIITNNAAAALAFPIAYSTALSLDVNYLPFVMAVAYGASASFITPYGYQTNLMVATAGGYSFKNFLQSGVLVSLMHGVIVIWLVPIFFPF